MKYTWNEFKADSVTGIINGITFGTLFSFFTYPFQFDKPETFQKYKGKPIYYYGSWIGRLSLGFGILQTSFNAISKQELGPAYELACMAGITLGVTQVLF